MYIILSILLAALTHKKLKTNFVILAFAMMLVNLVDIDHIITYNFAIEGANPFKIFILHRFWAWLCLTVFLIALILKEKQHIIFGIGLALALHFFLEWVLFALHIDFPTIIYKNIYLKINILPATRFAYYLTSSFLTLIVAFGFYFGCRKSKFA
ncbi:MAG: hypothetical protein LBC89_00660 [Bacteroidales bacterium]|jgi:hypothetical protein|nr:hypothetical protein [Bacteroidales bacterium]